MKSILDKSILLVEDDAIIALSQSEKIKEFGFSVVVVHSGEDAIDVISKNGNIDLILMDVDLGDGLNGPDAAQLILEKINIPIVFLTSHSEKEMVEKVRGITRYGYVIKNSGDFVLQSSIEMALELFDANQLVENKVKELQASEILTNLALHGTEQGIWEFDLIDNKITYISNLFEIIGYKPDESSLELQWFLEHLDPDSINVFNEALNNYKNGITKFLSWECKILDHNGQWLWIEAHGSFEENTLAPVKLIGTYYNKTNEKKQKEIELLRNKTLQAIHQYSLDLAYQPYHEIYPLISKNITSLFNASISWISIFDEETSELVLVYSNLSDEENSNISKTLGSKIIGFRTPTNEEQQALMKNVVVAKVSSLHELSFGAIPKIISNTIKKIFGIDWFVTVALINQNKINGVLVLGGLAENSDLNRDDLLAFAGITANAIERKRAEEALYENEKRYRLLAENSTDVIWLMDLDFNISYISPSIYKMSGWTQDEVIAMTVTDYILPESLVLIYDMLNAELDLEREDRSDIKQLDIKQITKDGSVVDVEITATFVYNDYSEVIGIQGSNRYVTERKIAEEKTKNLLNEKELLLKEVHHRIKNNMDVITSLLSLQLNSSKDDSIISALQEAKSRMLSMGVLYDKLYRSENLKEASLHEFLSPLIDEIISIFPYDSSISINKDIEGLILSAEILSTIGILINELLTNAIKYAFEGEKDNLIEIKAFLNDQIVTIIVSDNGIGLPEDIDISNPVSFGLKLVRVLADQLTGTIEVDRNSGTIYTLKFSVDH